MGAQRLKWGCHFHLQQEQGNVETTRKLCIPYAHRFKDRNLSLNFAVLK